MSRGREDDGPYVSLDVADRFFDAEAQGYLIILGSGPKDDPANARALAEKPVRCFRWPSSGPTRSGRVTVTERRG